MDKEKPLEGDLNSKRAFSSDAADWLNTFKKLFSIEFQDAISSLPDASNEEQLQRVAIRAMTTTLLDSGLSDEQLLASIGEAFEEVDSAPPEWSPELNRRRIDLIDRRIEQSITFDEKIELARLTRSLRACVSTDELFPMKGARALHSKLRAMDQREDRR